MSKYEVGDMISIPFDSGHSKEHHYYIISNIVGDSYQLAILSKGRAATFGYFEIQYSDQCTDLVTTCFRENFKPMQKHLIKLVPLTLKGRFLIWFYGPIVRLVTETPTTIYIQSLNKRYTKFLSKKNLSYKEINYIDIP